MTAQDAMDMYYGFSMGQSISRIAAAPAAAAAASLLSLPVAPVIAVVGVITGAAAIVVRARVRRGASAMADVQHAGDELIAEASEAVRNEMENGLANADYVLSTTFRTLLDERIEEVNSLIATQTGAAKSDAQDLNDRKRQLQSCAARKLDREVDLPLSSAWLAR